MTDKYIIIGSMLEQIRQQRKNMDIALSFFKILSDKKRFEIVKYFSKNRWYANELAKKLKITPATMSYHINKLFTLGLINADTDNENQKKIFYSVNKEKLKEIFIDAYKLLTGEEIEATSGKEKNKITG